jgi:hypothetical protein
MSLLSSIKFSTEKRPTPNYRSSPIEKARSALLKGVATQILLLKAERDGVPHGLMKEVHTTDNDGNIITKQVALKPRKWFWRNPQGAYIVEVLFSNHPLALDGKNTAIDAGDLNGVEQVLSLISDAVANGELDKAITEAKSKRKPRAKKATQ